MPVPPRRLAVALQLELTSAFGLEVNLRDPHAAAAGGGRHLDLVADARAQDGGAQRRKDRQPPVDVEAVDAIPRTGNGAKLTLLALR